MEIQQDNEGASPKRARYHSGLMDMNTLNAGQDFDELPETYVIFITREDVLGYDLPIYHVERMIKEVAADFQDESHMIYVNSSRRDDTDLGHLMQDFCCKEAKAIRSEVLSRRVYELKETPKGVDIMCSEMDRIYKEGAEEGELKKAKEVAFTLSGRGMSAEMIAETVKVNIALVQQWLSGNAGMAR